MSQDVMIGFHWDSRVSDQYATISLSLPFISNHEAARIYYLMLLFMSSVRLKWKTIFYLNEIRPVFWYIELPIKTVK